MSKKWFYSLMSIGILSLASFWGCQKTDNPSTPPPVDQLVTASINGRVLNEKNEPINGATVKAGNTNTTTDVNGHFSFTNVSISQNAGLVSVEKAGYFNGSRTFIATAGSSHFVTISLITQSLTASFSATVGGNITVPGGVNINFPSNGIVNAATNAPYSGIVAVNAFFLDPTAPNFNDIMPGTLRGITTGNEERGLQSFGMVAVELKSAANEKLQLASGKTAQLIMQIPAALQASAPATIPLWFFDETKGLWKEEGIATKTGSNYVGSVAHFSFWNCDAPFPVVDFQAIFKDQNGNAVQGYKVQMKTISDTVSILGYGITDMNGKVAGKIPSGKTLQMKVYNKCGTLVHTQNIGPYNNAVNLGTITLNVSPTANIVISGTAVTCTNTPVTNGFVNVLLDGINHRSIINNGTFSLTINRCDNNNTSAIVKAVDIANTQEGAAATIAVSSGNVTTGQLVACGNSIAEFINLTINGTLYALTSPGDSLMVFRQGSITFFDGSTSPGTSNYTYTYFTVNGTTAAGTYPVEALNVFAGNKNYTKNGTINTTITEYGALNGFIAGSFTGMLRDSSNGGSTVPVICNYRLKRSF